MTWGMVAVAAATVVGGAVNYKSNKDSQKATATASDKAAAQLEETTGAARADLEDLFSQSGQRQEQGFQGALDVFGQSLPAQTDVFTQGNVAAQQQILQGLPQIQNALMGNQVDYSQLQPFQVQQPDLSFFQQQLPQKPAQQTLPQDYIPVGPEEVVSDLSGNTKTPSEIDKFLSFNRKVFREDPVNRLAVKKFEDVKKIATKDPVVRGIKKLFSDKRLKENIKEVGELAGQKLYTWTWKDTEETKSFAGDAGIGFIAQEVEKTLPHAVYEEDNGYKKIDISVIFKVK